MAEKGVAELEEELDVMKSKYSKVHEACIEGEREIEILQKDFDETSKLYR